MNTTDENLQPASMSVLNHVATVTINRPEAMNAIDPETSERLSGFWKEILNEHVAGRKYNETR